MQLAAVSMDWEESQCYIRYSSIHSVAVGILCDDYIESAHMLLRHGCMQSYQPPVDVTLLYLQAPLASSWGHFRYSFSKCTTPASLPPTAVQRDVHRMVQVADKSQLDYEAGQEGGGPESGKDKQPQPEKQQEAQAEQQPQSADDAQAEQDQEQADGPVNEDSAAQHEDRHHAKPSAAEEVGSDFGLEYGRL